MTNQEALEHLKKWVNGNIKASHNPHISESLKSMIAVDVEAMRMAIAVIEAREPRSPVSEWSNEYLTRYLYCPKCKNRVDSDGDDHYCRTCGQRLK